MCFCFLNANLFQLCYLFMKSTFNFTHMYPICKKEYLMELYKQNKKTHLMSDLLYISFCSLLNLFFVNGLVGYLFDFIICLKFMHQNIICK